MHSDGLFFSITLFTSKYQTVILQRYRADCITRWTKRDGNSVHSTLADSRVAMLSSETSLRSETR